jgi:hypothetical protein
MSALLMNWKSTAAVSSVTLLATWLGWTPAHQLTVTEAPATTRAVRPVDAADIQDQAARLQTRVRSELGYQDPKRNPFRFTARPMPSAPPARAIEATVAPLPVSIPVFPFTLSGMATESVEGQSRRTAILTTASDVLFAKLGDQVGSYTITRIDEAGVEFTATDGTVRTLALTP